MHYAEVQTFSGRWSPQAFSEKPAVKDGRLRVSDGARGRIRALQVVPPHHRHLPLSELQRLYGTREVAEADQTAAVDSIDDAELVDEPVFRSGRAVQ